MNNLLYLQFINMKLNDCMNIQSYYHSILILIYLDYQYKVTIFLMRRCIITASHISVINRNLKFQSAHTWSYFALNLRSLRYDLRSYLALNLRFLRYELKSYHALNLRTMRYKLRSYLALNLKSLRYELISYLARNMRFLW